MASFELLQKPLDANGKVISNLGVPTTEKDATYTDLVTDPADVGATAAPGTSKLAAPADHVHEAVHGIGVDGGAVVSGDVNFVSGSGIAVEIDGNDIIISAAPGSVNKINLTHEGAAYNVGTTEDIIREFYVNFDDAGAASIKVMLAAIVKADAGIGSFSVYTGATAPGSTAGGTVRATITTTGGAEELKENLGAAFANPGGNKLVQITADNDTALAKSFIRGISVSIG